MGVKLPEVYIDAKGLLSEVLHETNTVLLSRYNSDFKEMGRIIHFHIEPKDEIDCESVGTVNMTLLYEVMVPDENGFVAKEITRDLALLNPVGDYKWNKTLKFNVWEGNYPTTVSVDKINGDVFLMHLYADNRVELQYFARLTENELELFLGDLNIQKPYKLSIDKDALFLYAGGDEGLNHLKRNVIIELDCGIPLEVRRGE